MKKILLFAYTKVNLGDNLFIYLLLKRYPNMDFYIHVVEKEYENVYNNFTNLHYIYEERDINKINIEEFDAYLYVGGSIFMESEYGMHEMKEFNKFIKKCKEYNKKFFYMSCNFGPYETQEYLELAKENFSLCDGICFRDKKSYDLFKEIQTVRYAPDIAFTFEIDKEKHKRKDNKTIGISVISLEIRENLKHLEVQYNDFIKRIIIKFAKRDYKVCLFSFSQFEQDDKAIKKIVEMLPQEYKNKVEVVLFDGDIEEYLVKYSEMKYMVCSRFHSMLLSMLFGQKIYNLTYSTKQDNVIRELKLFRKYQQIKNITFETVLRKYYFKNVKQNKIEKAAKEAEIQFWNLDEYINSNS